MTVTATEPTGITERPATAADIPVLHPLINNAYRGDTARKSWTHEADMLGGQRCDPPMLEDIIAHTANDSQLIVYEQDKQIIGCVQCIVKLKDNQRAGYFGILASNPDVQLAGLGKYMMQSMEHYLHKTCGCNTIECTVIHTRKELLAYYKRRGYLPTGERSPFPITDDNRYGIPLVPAADLEFVVLEKRFDKDNAN